MVELSTIKTASLFVLAIVSILAIVLFVYVMIDKEKMSTGILAISSVLFVGALGFITTMVLKREEAMGEIKSGFDKITKPAKVYIESMETKLKSNMASLQSKIDVMRDPGKSVQEKDALKKELAELQKAIATNTAEIAINKIDNDQQPTQQPTQPTTQYYY